MPEDTLEQVRLLSNLESSRHKLLQIVLFGQPELDAALDQPAMRQLKDRITHNFRTRPLTAAEAGKYISFRMRAAGYKGPEVFTPAAVNSIARASSGLTRRINVLCDKSLLAAFAAGSHAITPRQVRAAVADSEFAPVPGRSSRGARLLAAGALLATGAVAGAGILLWIERDKAAPPVAAAPAAPSGPAVAPAAPPTPAPAPGAAPSQPTPAAAAVTPAPADETPPAPLLAPEQQRRLDGYAAGRNALLRERLAATRARLESEPDTGYSIELFVAENSDAARTERFLLRARELVPLAEIYVIPLATGAGYFLRVTYGSFPSKEAAAEAARHLPPKYQNAFQLQPRSFADLRAAI